MISSLTATPRSPPTEQGLAPQKVNRQAMSPPLKERNLPPPPEATDAASAASAGGNAAAGAGDEADRQPDATSVIGTERTNPPPPACTPSTATTAATKRQNNESEPERKRKKARQVRRVTASPLFQGATSSSAGGFAAAAAADTSSSKSGPSRKSGKRKAALDFAQRSSEDEDIGGEESSKAAASTFSFKSITSSRRTEKRKVMDLLDSSDDDGDVVNATSSSKPSRGNKRGSFQRIDDDEEDDSDDDFELRMAIEESLKVQSKPNSSSSSSARSAHGRRFTKPAGTTTGTRRRRRRVRHENDDDITNTARQSGSGRDEWLTSFHTTQAQTRGQDEASSSDDDSSSDSDEGDELDHRLAAISRRNWLTSSSRDDKLDHMHSIANAADKILQLMLWDVGFDYKIFSHQFEAIRFVAGLVSTFPCRPTNDISYTNEDTEEMLRLDGTGSYARSAALRSAASKKDPLILPTRGMLLADEMGLGKTIEALAGAALRNAMQLGTGGTKNSPRRLPTLIISPQDGVQAQWHDTLIKAGVEPARITVVGERRKVSKRRSGMSSAGKGGYYILCTRYKVQSEMKKLFECATTTDLHSRHKTSLFPHIPLSLIKKLRNQYQSENGKERNHFIKKKEPKQDCVARLVKDSSKRGRTIQSAFQTVVIDEAHFVKNVLAYWGLGSALLGAQSKRTVLLTGTPFNNGPSDMSALMTYIDPQHEGAKIRWWEKATAKGSKKDVVEAVKDWRTEFMLRRTKDVLQNKLPPRVRDVVNVAAYPSELGIYEAYEASFLDALDQMTENMEDGSPESRRRVKELFDIMMACMSCMRMSLLHPMLPGGREITIQFSPSRRHLLKREECSKRCVLCSGSYPTQKAEKFASKKAGIDAKQEKEEDDDQPMLGLDAIVRHELDLDDDELDDEDAIDALNDVDDQDKGPLVKLGPDMCKASASDCRHFAHERCLEVFLEKNCAGECPRCFCLNSRIHITDPMHAGKKLPHKVYCEGVTPSIGTGGGFTASAKIEEAINWFQNTVPKNEKAIILSFFKGSLDLLEGILTEEFDVECVRYDGDVDKAVRSRELQRFKTSGTCRVLLASVQSGGTGLNITEANHICFLDRWFNPCTHDQAESRCHRIGQKKKVKIAYLDTTLTVDMVMKRVNVLKEGNADVLLADGTSLGDRWSLGYQNLAGVIGSTLKAIVDMRRSFVANNIAKGDADAPLPFYDDSDFETKLAETMMGRSSRKKRPAIKPEKEGNQDEDNDDDDGKEDSSSSESKSEQKSSPPGLNRTYSTSSSSSSDYSILDGGPMFEAKTDRRGSESTASSKESVAPTRSPVMSESGNSDALPTVSAGKAANVNMETQSSMSSSDPILNEVIFPSARKDTSKQEQVEKEHNGITTSPSVPRNVNIKDSCNEIIVLSSDEEDSEVWYQEAVRRSLEEQRDAALKQEAESTATYGGVADDQKASRAFTSESSAGPMEESAKAKSQHGVGDDGKAKSKDRVASSSSKGNDLGSTAKADLDPSTAIARSTGIGTAGDGELQSKESLVHAMNEAMQAGDISRAEVFFKQWKDS